jgi:catechol 2,3-dioxygenase-like lactoylglutathione lyase family enzyme
MYGGCCRDSRNRVAVEEGKMNAALGLLKVKVIALAVSDRLRAEKFYGETLGLPPAFEGDVQVGYHLDQTILMLKEDWYGTPTATPNPRITIASEQAVATEAELKRRGVVIADPVQAYDDGFYVGSFLDSEGNKLWFCSPVTAGEDDNTLIG